MSDKGACRTALATPGLLKKCLDGLTVMVKLGKGSAIDWILQQGQASIALVGSITYRANLI